MHHFLTFLMVEWIDCNFFKVYLIEKKPFIVLNNISYTKNFKYIDQWLSSLLGVSKLKISPPFLKESHPTLRSKESKIIGETTSRKLASVYRCFYFTWLKKFGLCNVLFKELTTSIIFLCGWIRNVIIGALTQSSLTVYSRITVYDFYL